VYSLDEQPTKKVDGYMLVGLPAVVPGRAPHGAESSRIACGGGNAAESSRLDRIQQTIHSATGLQSEEGEPFSGSLPVNADFTRTGTEESPAESLRYADSSLVRCIRQSFQCLELEAQDHSG